MALTTASAVLVAGGIVSLLPDVAEAAPTQPNTKKLAGDLAKQKLAWEKCDFQDPDINTRFANLPNVQCATVKVPRDWKDPGNGKTWDIRISQAKNIDVKNARYKGTVFTNPGGPGGSGLVWGPAMQQRTPDLNPYYNYIGFDPRGVGQSSKAECTYTWDLADPDPNAANKAMGEACSTNPDVRTITSEQTTYDMDFIRGLLGAPKLSYIGYSYGTWLGSWFSKVFPATSDRMVLDSSTRVTDPTLQATWDLQPIARDRQFDKHMLNWIARNDATYGLGTDPYQIRQRYFAAIKNMDMFGIVLIWAWGGGAAAFGNNTQYPVAASTVKSLIEVGEGTATAGKSGASDPIAVVDRVLAKVQTSPELSKASQQRVATQRARITKLKAVPQKSASARTQAAEPMPATLTNTEPFEYIRCGDGQWTQGANYWNKANAATKAKAPFTASWGLLDSAPTCAFWRTNNVMPVADPTTYPKTFVIQGELDSQTAWETGKDSALKLPNTKGIFIDNEGSHGQFPYGTECADRSVYTFFLTGNQPAARSKTCQALPLPGETTVYESWGKLNNAGKHITFSTSPFEEAVTKPGQLNRAAGLSPVQAAGSGEVLKPIDPALNAKVLSLLLAKYGPAGVNTARKVNLVD